MQAKASKHISDTDIHTSTYIYMISYMHAVYIIYIHVEKETHTHTPSLEGQLAPQTSLAAIVDQEVAIRHHMPRNTVWGLGIRV